LATELQAFLLPLPAGEKPRPTKGPEASRQEQFAARRATAAAGVAVAGAKDGAGVGSTAKTKDGLKSMLQKEWTSILRRMELEQPIAKKKAKKKRSPPPTDGASLEKRGPGRPRKTKELTGGGVNRGQAPKRGRPAKRLKSSVPVDGTTGMDGLREGEEDLESVDPEPGSAAQTVLRLLAAAAATSATTTACKYTSNLPLPVIERI